MRSCVAARWRGAISSHVARALTRVGTRAEKQATSDLKPARALGVCCAVCCTANCRPLLLQVLNVDGCNGRQTRGDV